MPGASPNRAGQAAEDHALEYLQGQGLRLLARNWRCKRGELDLVMLDADTVVFVEVRYRLHAEFGGALASIDGRKQQRLALAANLFLQQAPCWATHPCRFDVVALQGQGHAGQPLQWLKNAFEC
ncbi:YraN family protein [Pseudomonas mosselii]|uniref:YraN family protein n=1 Tax=Pseudomonas mosselii TaxID=78327 RepID=UPI0007705903|nr:YraN family protein [Pseudomonas mosselii]AMK32737.1 putative endonuclease distantly related to archaeal Holliday junction resolvase [Pseudomonas putida]MBC3450050.1 YraN family protein [Pseudomonas mosselii]MDH1657191.1 YraN family protein [Pseudomonas mosselii]MDH1718348.1 YraN family protein [Pseudomonas mosselii]MDH1723584.1 YraN family protein [Pseudomonas mosselii]